MAEWSNAADSKSVVQEIESGVQIPLSSPKILIPVDGGLSIKH